MRTFFCFASFAGNGLPMAIHIVAIGESLRGRVAHTAATYYNMRRVVCVETHVYTVIEYIQFAQEIFVGVFFHVGNDSIQQLIHFFKSAFYEKS
jgi:hypothetical protein